MRREPTDAEACLWRRLRDRRFAGWKFRRQQPLGPFVVDFVCFSPRLIIELDGSQHLDARAYDARRTAWLAARGFRLLRYWNGDVLESIEDVLEEVHRTLSQQ